MQRPNVLRLQWRRTLVLAVFATTTASAQEAKKTMAIAEIIPTPAIAERMQRDGKKNEMDRVIQSLDSQLIDRVNATRKFTIMARSDLPTIIQGGVFSPDTLKKLANLDYLLAATVDDFQDYTRTATAETGERAARRIITLSAVGKIYEAKSGKLLESANFQIRREDRFLNPAQVTESATLSDALFVGIARDMADKIANRVVDVIFSPKVLVKRDKQITINRGDGTDIAVGQIWNVFAVGQELIDPDTKESLGREEVLIGKARVTSVLPMTSTAEILEDNGVDKDAILRRPQEALPKER